MIVQENINNLRKEIDQVDSQLLQLLSGRMYLVRQIGKAKKTAGLAVVQPDRFENMLTNRLERAKQLKLNETFIENFMNLIHEESIRLQSEL